MPRPGSLGKSLLRMAFGPGRLSEYYYYYYYLSREDLGHSALQASDLSIHPCFHYLL